MGLDLSKYRFRKNRCQCEGDTCTCTLTKNDRIGLSDEDLWAYEAKLRAEGQLEPLSKADDDEGWEIQLEDGTWVHEDDLSDEELEAVIEAWDDLEEIDQVDDDDDLDDEESDEDDDDEDDDDEFIEEEEDTYDDEQEPAMSKLSKAAEVNSALSKAAADKVAEMISKAADDILAIDDRFVNRPRSERDSIRRVMVLKDNPDLYDDYRQLRDSSSPDVSKGMTVQRGMEPLMARINSLSEAEMKRGATREQALVIVLRSQDIAARYRQARGIPSGVPAVEMTRS
jgi:hypothetical protein